MKSPTKSGRPCRGAMHPRLRLFFSQAPRYVCHCSTSSDCGVYASHSQTQLLAIHSSEPMPGERRATEALQLAPGRNSNPPNLARIAPRHKTGTSCVLRLRRHRKSIPAGLNSPTRARRQSLSPGEGSRSPCHRTDSRIDAPYPTPANFAESTARLYGNLSFQAFRSIRETK